MVRKKIKEKEHGLQINFPFYVGSKSYMYCIKKIIFSNVVAGGPTSPGPAGAAAVPQGASASSPSSGASRTVANLIQDDEVARWAARLPRARVSRWGGMISTPDAVLQVSFERGFSLIFVRQPQRLRSLPTVQLK